ncbi:MAG: DEAD/DEAH box helicase [Spirochaetales bacterium]|nr:DEAD/DEAH box helicase [Spirochaetales bacterium]
MSRLAKFEALGLSDITLGALEKKGFEEPTEIQNKIIPCFLSEDRDMIGQAQTGTGKTAAFGIPLLELIKPIPKTVQALILVPTRELAIQVAEEINSLATDTRVRVAPIYGGQNISVQINLLKRGVDIIVGTPGRVIDHLKRKTLQIESIRYFILDEADEMLSMGFIEDIEEILKHASPEHRTLLFSATMPTEIYELSQKYMNKPKIFQISKKQLTGESTEQIYFEVRSQDRFEALCRLIDMEKDFYGLIFCRTKIDTDQLSQDLARRGYEADALHGDISQHMRERILGRFKEKQIRILTATDVAARGIDIENLTHVINYSLPQNPESYVHRIGRTGRAGRQGTAVTFVTPDEYRRLMFIKRISKSEIKKMDVPSINQVINQKKEQIKTALNLILETQDLEGYIKIAEEFLAQGKEVEKFAALLKYTLQDELEESRYQEIEDVNLENKGKTRLFVALGESDGMTKKSVINLITQKSGVPGNLIRDVGVYDSFSFISVPFVQAEKILKAFSSTNKNKPSLVTKAHQDKEKVRKKEGKRSFKGRDRERERERGPRGRGKKKSNAATSKGFRFRKGD